VSEGHDPVEEHADHLDEHDQREEEHEDEAEGLQLQVLVLQGDRVNVPGIRTCGRVTHLQINCYGFL